MAGSVPHDGVHGGTCHLCRGTLILQLSSYPACFLLQDRSCKAFLPAHPCPLSSCEVCDRFLCFHCFFQCRGTWWSPLTGLWPCELGSGCSRAPQSLQALFTTLTIPQSMIQFNLFCTMHASSTWKQTIRSPIL